MALLLFFWIAKLEQPPWRCDVAIGSTEICVAVAYTLVLEKEQDGRKGLISCMGLKRDRKMKWFMNKNSEGMILEKK